MYRDNLEAFLLWYPNVGEAIRAHDAALHRLAAVCNIAFRRLLEVGDFTAAVIEADAMATQKGISIEQTRGAVPAEEWPRLLAEYVINNVRTLPEHYTTATYWRHAAPIILRVRDAASLRQEFDKLDRIGEEVLQAAENAEKTLVAVRLDYTRRFGLPPVPLASHTDPGEM